MTKTRNKIKELMQLRDDLERSFLRMSAFIHQETNIKYQGSPLYNESLDLLNKLKIELATEVINDQES